MSRVTAEQLQWLIPASVVFYSVLGRSTDALLLVGFLLFQQRYHISSHVPIRAVDVRLISLQCAVTAFAVLHGIRYCMRKTADKPRWSGQGRPLLLPCKTTHSRLFPEKHSFAYSYLVVGIPVGWEGNAGGMVSCYPSAKQGSDTVPWWSLRSVTPRAWYHIDPADYLERGDGHLGLRGKLDMYLKSQGADPALFPHVYLVTAARFLGHHFNPASFWYLYSVDLSLAAMIIEVNNTFDERRMYFLTLTETNMTKELSSSEPSPADASGRTDSRTTPIFKQAWPKDFHVSPFNSRKGSYSLVASDPWRTLFKGNNMLDCTITMKSSKGHGKIVARIFSDGPPVEPSTMTLWQKARFLLSWWWVGFATFPRIVKEAGRLFFRRRLHVWYRPEPLKESIGRSADATERELELMFRRYLRRLVDRSTAAIAVKYIASGVSDLAKELVLSPPAHNGTADVAELEFKVLTPAFYSRFVYYAHDLEALFSELRENHTIWISQPDLLPKLLFKKPAPPLQIASYTDFIYFKAIQYLRRRPERIERPLTSSMVPASLATTAVDIRDFRISSMDAFLLGQEDKHLKQRYRRVVLKLFLADRVALGSIQLLEGSVFIFRVWLAWALLKALGGLLPPLLDK